MGLVNYDFTSMDQITDVEAKGYYAEHIRTESHEEVFQKILAGTREHTRVLLPWNKQLPPYHTGLSQKTKRGIWNVYKKLIALRQSDDTFVYGEFEVINKKKDRFVYRRRQGSREYLIDCNLGNKKRKAYSVGKQYEPVFFTRKDAEEHMGELKSYEARIWRKKKSAESTGEIRKIYPYCH